MKRFPKPPVIQRPQIVVPECEIEIMSRTELSHVIEKYSSGRYAAATYAKENKESAIKYVIQEAKKAFNCIDCDCLARSIRITMYEQIERYDTLRRETYQETAARNYTFYSCSNDKCDWCIPVSDGNNRFQFDFSRFKNEKRSYFQEVLDAYNSNEGQRGSPRCGWELKLWNRYHKTSKSARKKRLEYRKNPPTYNPISMLEL